MKRKAVVIIIVIVVLILIAVSTWLIYKKYIKAPVVDNSGGGDQTPPPYTGGGYSGGGGGGGYSPSSFPVKKGMSGSTVADIQDSINKKCKSNLVTDGIFGPKTEAALKSCYSATEVSQALYTQMKMDSGASGAAATVTGTTGSTSGFSAGAFVYLKPSVTNVYTYPAFDSTYILGSIEKSIVLDKPIGIYVSSATNGFSKIRLIGYKPYGKTEYIKDVKDAYISTSNIQKAPY